MDHLNLVQNYCFFANKQASGKVRRGPSFHNIGAIFGNKEEGDSSDDEESRDKVSGLNVCWRLCVCPFKSTRVTRVNWAEF